MFAACEVRYNSQNAAQPQPQLSYISMKTEQCNIQWPFLFKQRKRLTEIHGTYVLRIHLASPHKQIPKSLRKSIRTLNTESLGGIAAAGFLSICVS